MEHRTYRAAIFDMDGVIVDSEIVYNEYLLAFAQTKNPAVVMDDINPMVGRTKKDSWMIMEHAINNGQTWEELFEEFRVLDIYQHVDYQKIFRPEALVVVKELKK
ncbi:MAG: HAD family phosphatase, partial [Lachnospiraceae bacterium]|nr:HAD family phosphatase [Lachnospiraceae bacterium]